MTVIYVVISLVFSAFLYEPLWFDTRTHHYHNTYQSDKACNHASIQVEETTGRVCVPKDNHSGQVDLYQTKE